MADENFIIGQWQATFFENQDNYYKVLLVDVEDTDTDYDGEEIVITGHFGEIRQGVPYQFYGKLVNHPKYGLQFKNEHYKKMKPSSKQALIQFLSGPKFKGIGPVIAENIVDELGQGAIDQILDQPDCLEGIKGVTAKRKQTLVQKLNEEAGADRIILKLNEWGISNQLAYKIYNHYQENTLEKIQDNPYQLVVDIDQMSFNQVDALAEDLGIEADSPQRMAGAMRQALQDHCFQTGDSYLLRPRLKTLAIELLEKARSFIIRPDSADQVLTQLINDHFIIEEQDRLYIPSLYAAEFGIAQHIERLMVSSSSSYSDESIDQTIQKIEKQEGICFGSSQKKAIQQALSSSVFILTGGPGTGKTTVVNGIVRAYAQLEQLDLDDDVADDHLSISLAAPTGRAAKALSDATGLASCTIHRLLGLTAEDDLDLDPKYFDQQLEADLLIIDEMSMVDTYLFHHLLSALNKGVRLILIGDKDQLPSVGPGQVFSDLIESQRIPSQELTEIYRQEEESSIPFLAAQIKNNESTTSFTAKKNDRSFIPCQDQQVVDVVAQIIKRALAAGLDAYDIQVLAPMYKGPAGIDALNACLQDVFNPNDDGKRKEIKAFGQLYRVNDKVLQLTNEAELNIFNGDIGSISSIELGKNNKDSMDRMTILFDQTEVEYQRSDFNKIKLAYCMSIHKAQGSEFKSVVVPFVKSYHRMLRKDLLYTAITRASESLVLCGQEAAFHYSLQHDHSGRHTTLVERLRPSLKDEELDGIETSKKTEPRSAASEEEKILTISLIDSEEIDPMIGMEKLTPYDC